ncbi:hypothetical protein [Dyella japonica]|uniref:Uncharacterized protein n=1 Tax=Dyella japonica TaxID=231455 RepID=A0ABV2JYD5_9GAMM
MRQLLAPLRLWLARRPALRRRLTLLIYRFPALDMRLRRLLHANEHRDLTLEVDAAHLSAPSRTVMGRLKARMPRA